MTWQDLKWERCRDPISDATIDAVQEQLRVRFPPSYRECVKACHAGAPRQNAFDIQDDEIGTFTSGLGMMLSFDADDDESVLAATQALAGRLPTGMVPFAIEAGGDYICFDYRGGVEPAIAYWSHEKETSEALTLLARNFEEFMSNLREE